MCPTNNTQSSTLYKLITGLAGWLAKKMTRGPTIYKLTDEAYNQEPSKLTDRIPSCRFLCPPPSHYFPSIYIGRKWDICYICEYISPSFPYSMLSQISVSLFLEHYLSSHLFIFLKMSGYAGRWTCGFTFAPLLLSRDTD